MQDGRLRLILAALLIVIFGLVVALMRATGELATQATPVDIIDVQTQAVRQFIYKLTAAASASPSSQPTARDSTSPTIAAASSGTPNCLGLRFIRDVTIPDNTEMTPAEVFTKTWFVENNGLCPWKPGFRVVLIGGVAMGGSPFKVTQTVGPGGTIQVSIKMVAPTNQNGVIQGTWKMTDGDGAQFGDYLSVIIVVSGSTQTAPYTATSSASAP
jgi:hypothetical protein